MSREIVIWLPAATWILASIALSLIDVIRNSRAARAARQDAVQAGRVHQANRMPRWAVPLVVLVVPLMAAGLAVVWLLLVLPGVITGLML